MTGARARDTRTLRQSLGATAAETLAPAAHGDGRRPGQGAKAYAQRGRPRGMGGGSIKERGVEDGGKRQERQWAARASVGDEPLGFGRSDLASATAMARKANEKESARK